MVFHSVFYQGADRETCARIIHANSRRLPADPSAVHNGDRDQRRSRAATQGTYGGRSDAGRERVHRLLALHLNKMVKEERFLMEKYAEALQAAKQWKNGERRFCTHGFSGWCLH